MHSFEREDDDLVHTATVTLEQALTGVDVKVETLDGRTLRCVCCVNYYACVGCCVLSKERGANIVCKLADLCSPAWFARMPGNSFTEPHVTPGTVKVIRGEGMPLQKKPTEKGNLKVRC